MTEFLTARFIVATPLNEIHNYSWQMIDVVVLGGG